MKRRKVLMIGMTVLFCAAAAIGGILLFLYSRQTGHYHSDQERIADLAALSERHYDALLLSMSDPAPFRAEDFTYFRELSTYKASHTFENLADIGNFLEEGFLQNPELSLVYLVIDPAAISSLYGDHASLYAKDYAKYLTCYAKDHPDTQFELLLPYYSLDYLQDLSHNRFEELIASCRNLVNICLPYDNMRFYFLGSEEWLIANPGSYASFNICNEETTHTILSFTFQGDLYRLTADNMEERFAALTGLTNTPAVIYPDYSDYSIVFFGDSVIGSYQGSLSIPGVVEGLSGASAYNIGLGGASACGNQDPTVHTLNTLIDAFLAGDNSSFQEHDSPYIGINDYLTGHPDKHCFLINCGLNDYFFGLPISSEDAYDPYTFSGSIRIAIAKLKEAYPGCRIILASPNFVSYYNAGKEKNSNVGGTLEDYVNAVQSLAEELQVDYMNNYEDFGLTLQNYELYLEDGCHPNVSLRYIYGQRIIEKLSDMLSTD